LTFFHVLNAEDLLRTAAIIITLGSNCLLRESHRLSRVDFVQFYSSRVSITKHIDFSISKNYSLRFFIQLLHVHVMILPEGVAENKTHQNLSSK